MAIVYTIIIHLVYVFMIPAAWFNKKAGMWIRGRKNWRYKLEQWQNRGRTTYWFHAASLGEFEQGLPVIEAMKDSNPGCSIVISFFSPSGYEVRKNYRNADLVIYLPLDTEYNARTLIDLMKPDAAFFIKYEFWYFYLEELKRRNIPVFLLSGVFRPGQIFFRWYGSWFRKELTAFRHLFLQDARSFEILKSIRIANASITGDTRFDRVKANAEKAVEIPVVGVFSERGICIVAGSTWPADEAILLSYINSAPPQLKFIIAPHEIGHAHISRLIKLIKKDLELYSLASPDSVAGKQVLIIDNIGMLSSVYRYGKIAYVGGGFGKGIHNVLEAAVFGIPVVFGPNYYKHREAIELIASGGGFTVGTKNELEVLMDKLTAMNEYYQTSATSAKNYIQSNTGSTKKILTQLNNELKRTHTIVI